MEKDENTQQTPHNYAEDCIRPPAPPEAESDSSKDTQTDQKSTETSVINLQRGFTPRLCNTRFTKEHKPSNHIRARIKSHVYTTERTVYHSTYHVKRYNKASTNVIYYINEKNV